MLPADRFDNPLPNKVIAKLGQSPAAERQSQGRRWLAREAPDGVDLPLGQARWHPSSAPLTQNGEAVWGKTAEVGIDRIDMHLKQLCHRGGGQARGMEQEGFSTTALPREQRSLQPLMDAAKFVGSWLPNTQGARHG